MVHLENLKRPWLSPACPIVALAELYAGESLANGRISRVFCGCSPYLKLIARLGLLGPSMVPVINDVGGASPTT